MASVEDYASNALVRFGVRSWLFVGIVIASSVIFYVSGLLGGLVVPLIVSVVIGMLFYPVVDMLHQRHVPRSIAAAIVLLGLLLVGVGIGWITVEGVISQGSLIFEQLNSALASITAWLATLDIPDSVAESLVESARTYAPQFAGGLAASFGSIFSTTIALFGGLFVGVFLLYYILADWHSIKTWVGRNLGGLPEEVGAGIVSDATGAIRRYFYALTLSSTIVAVLIGAAMAVLGLPLAFTVAIVTLATSYIPYLGAIISGAFAFLVALGSGGLEAALFVLVVVLVTQNVVQTIVQNKLAADQLDMHPLVSFISTIVGATMAGLLGATLAAPIVAMIMRIVRRLRAYHEQADPA